jgi:hypothetical protein
MERTLLRERVLFDLVREDAQMVGLVQLLLRETGIALLLGLIAYVLAGQGAVMGAVGFILSLATAGVYAMGHALVGRLLSRPGRSTAGPSPAAPHVHRPGWVSLVLTALAGLLLGWLLLVPLLGGESSAVRTLIAALVAIYVGLRLLSELLWPVIPVRRPVIKDQIVAQAERLLARGARPYATRPDGSLEEEAVSFLVEPEEAEPLRAALADLLAPHPVVVSLGDGELVIRPAPGPGEPA